MVFIPMEVLKQENVMSTNHACFGMLCVLAGFTTGFACWASTGLRAGSIMFLQGNSVKIFIKIQVLKSQGAKCRCTYGVILPGEYLQVARWWQQRCLCIRCNTTWSSLRASTTTPTCVTYQLHCSSFSIPTKETIQVYSHLGTHAMPAVDSPRLKIVTITYECSEASSDALPLIAVYVTCSSTPAPSATTDSSWGSLKIEHRKLW